VQTNNFFLLNSSLNVSNESPGATKARTSHNWKAGPYQVIQKLKAERHKFSELSFTNRL